MEKMKDLKDLLKHEVMDLYSAEEQIIAAMPKMIGNVTNPELKKALKEHLKVTEGQKRRLDKVKKILSEGEEGSMDGKKKGILGLFGLGEQVCKGMQGLIEEGQKVMGENMSPEVMDAAIIACAQKIEHYEICGYGTARAYARELNLGEVAGLLEETLAEEYAADDLLTNLAVGSINEEAEESGEEEDEEMQEENAGAMAMANNNRGRSGSSSGRSSGSGGPRSSAGKSGGGRKAPATKTASSRTSGSGPARSKSSTKTASKKSASASKSNKGRK
jgi:ferritin-like metal-binding protein YciE